MVASNYIPLNDHRRLKYETIDGDIAESWKKDILWMADVTTDSTDSTPMWVGWNANLIPREDFKQTIGYLPQLKQSPTSHAVVL